MGGWSCHSNHVFSPIQLLPPEERRIILQIQLAQSRQSEFAKVCSSSSVRASCVAVFIPSPACLEHAHSDILIIGVVLYSGRGSISEMGPFMGFPVAQRHDGAGASLVFGNAS